ncbi:MAG: TIR domain-containing protein [Ferruginibacter sp.]
MLNELFEWIFGTDAKKERRKVFISFAIEDKRYRDFLVSQAKNDRTPFDFIDMSVKEAWKESEWKIQCRKKIKKCDSMIVLLSKNTWHSGGSRWGIKCAREEGLRIIGMHIKRDDKGAIPPELYRKKIIQWSWSNLENFLN